LIVRAKSQNGAKRERRADAGHPLSCARLLPAKASC